MKTALGWVLAIVGTAACSVSPVDYGFEGGKAGAPDAGSGNVQTKSACVSSSKKTDPLAYPACACAKGGAARCVPTSEIPSALASQLDTCSGGACVPETIIASGGAPPKKCDSPFGEGRCVSLCVPAVSDKASVLDRGEGEACATDERCVPCKNPLANGESTGVCEMGNAATEACDEGGSTSGGPGGPPPGTTCTAPASCRSVNDSEGRCLPLSLPMVAEQKDLLPASTCGADARCAPCFHPLTGQPSGACSSVACDAPKEPAKTLTSCCRNHGRCVPKDVVPASARDSLDDDDGRCAEDQELCVPNELLAPVTPPQPCTVSLPFVGTYQGICVSDCFDTLVPSGNCPGDLVCAPNQ